MQLKAHEPPKGPSPLNHAALCPRLERILGSELFRRPERLSAFLRFVTEDALSGRGDVPEEQVLGAELYGKRPESDGSTDPIERVDARRLRDFSISLDGANLAFIRFEHPCVAGIYVLPMGGGQPRHLTNWRDGEFAGVTWMPNGTELLYSTKGRLWRIPANLAQPGRGSPIEAVTPSAENPAISRSRPGQPARLVFQAINTHATFRIVDLAAPQYNGVFQAVQPFVAPSDFVGTGAFSPDGRKFMFASGPPPLRLWTSAVDGTAQQAAGGHWSRNSRYKPISCWWKASNDTCLCVTS